MRSRRTAEQALIRSKQMLIIIGIYMALGVVLTTPQVMGVPGYGEKRSRSPIEKTENVDAIEGQDLILVCELEHGWATWLKNEVKLYVQHGDDSNTHQVLVGDPYAGNFTLIIYNISIYDSGKYQCQRSTDGFSSFLVNVLRPPKNIEIKGVENNGEIKLAINEEVNITCSVNGSRPESEIVWYRDDVEFKPANEEHHVQKYKPPELAKDPSIPVKFKYRYKTNSTIKLTISSQDDGTKVTCKPKHEAMRPFDTMSATVRLNVAHAPGHPVIEGYKEGDIIRKGEVKTLICSSKGGNPRPQLTWLKNDNEVVSTYSMEGRTTKINYTFAVEDYDNNAVLVCVVSSQNYEAQSATVKLTVYYPPYGVAVNGPEYGAYDKVVAVNCTVEASNPAAEIKWLVDGREKESTRLKQDPIGGDFGWKTTAYLKFKFHPSKQTLTVVCVAKNPYTDDNKMVIHHIGLLRLPGSPIIIHDSPGDYFYEGRRYSLLCKSKEGNPSAKIKWFRNGEEVLTQCFMTDGFYACDISIVVKETDNGAVFKCRVSHIELDEDLYASMALNVYFGPNDAPRISHDPKVLIEGDSAKLTCWSPSCNPKCEVQWLENGVVVTEGVPKRHYESGEFGGFVTVAKLQLNLTPNHNGKVYTCRSLSADHHKVMDLPYQPLDVLYKPIFQTRNYSIYNEREGSYVIINFQIEANPSEIDYTWVRKNNVIYDLGGSTMEFPVVARTDAGFYKCKARNKIGETILEFSLNVQYEASVTNITKVRYANEGSDVELVCNLDGHPLENNHVIWTRGNMNLTSTVFGNKTSTLIVRDVSPKDVGSYFCIVNNGIGRNMSSTAILLINFGPIASVVGKYNTTAARLTETGKLMCKAEGAPEIKFLWSVGKKTIPKINTEKFSFEEFQPDVSTYMSYLQINNVQEEDFGVYTCTAINTRGKSSVDIIFQPLSAPDAPDNVRVINATVDSVKLSWLPGFDGGDIQKFHIDYFQNDSTPNDYVAVEVGLPSKFTITSLTSETCYVFGVTSYNSVNQSAYSNVTGCTLPGDPLVGEMMTYFMNMTWQEYVILLVITASGLCFTMRLRQCYVKTRDERNRSKLVRSRNSDNSAGSRGNGTSQRRSFMSRICCRPDDSPAQTYERNNEVVDLNVVLGRSDMHYQSPTSSLSSPSRLSPPIISGARTFEIASATNIPLTTFGHPKKVQVKPPMFDGDLVFGSPKPTGEYNLSVVE